MVGQGAGDHRLSGRVLDCNALAADHGFIYRAACERVSVKSALMRSRGRRTTRSPRTSWLASMTLNWPSRRTRALIAKRVPPRSGHPLLLPSVLTVALPSGLAAWLAWRRSTWAPVAVIDIAAPAEEIFDVIVDARNEPRWNPKMLRAQMLTPGPVAAGTTFRVVFGRGVGEALIEDTKIDRPRSWTATSRSRALDAQTEGQIHDISGRCEVFLHTQLRSPRVLAPAHSGVGLVDAPDLGSRPAQGEGPCRA
jgi:hypothetical protein